MRTLVWTDAGAIRLQAHWHALAAGALAIWVGAAAGGADAGAAAAGGGWADALWVAPPPLDALMIPLTP
jgi:hypothetical protein